MNMFKIGEKKMHWCSIVALIEDESNIWFLQNNKNGLFCMDKKLKKLKWIPFLEESFCIPSLYLNMQKIDSKIVCVPHGANKIAVYDIKNKNTKYVSFEKNRKRTNEVFMPYANFLYSFIYKRNVYMLGYSYPAILKYNIDTDNISYLDDWIDEVNKKIPENDMRGIFGRGFVHINLDVILLPFACSNGLLKLNMKTDETEIIWLQSGHNGIAGISSDVNNRIWMVGHGTNDDKVIIWEYNSNNYEVKQIPDVRKEKLFPSFYQPIITENRVYFVPLKENHIYSIGINDENIEVDLFLEKMLNIADNTNEPLLKYYLTGIDRNMLSVIRSHDLSWHKINLNTMDDHVQEINDREFNNIYIETMSKYERFNTIMNETTMPLNLFIKFLQNRNY